MGSGLTMVYSEGVGVSWGGLYNCYLWARCHQVQVCARCLGEKGMVQYVGGSYFKPSYFSDTLNLAILCSQGFSVFLF